MTIVLTWGILIITFMAGLVVGARIQRYISAQEEERAQQEELHYEPLPCGSDDHIRGC